ncbi:MAG: ATP-binding protein [Pirellulaceae bacterium]
MNSARNNPFAAQQLERIDFRFLVGSWHDALEQLQRMNWRGTVIGKCGSGKSTLLRQLAQKLNREVDRWGASHYEYVSIDKSKRQVQWRRMMEAIERNEILLLDGLERFSWSQRWHLIFGKELRTAKIIGTTHRRMGLPVWIQLNPDADTIEYCLRELVPIANDDLITRCIELFGEHDGNLREAFRSLYDEWPIWQRKLPCPTEVGVVAQSGINQGDSDTGN